MNVYFCTNYDGERCAIVAAKKLACELLAMSAYAFKQDGYRIAKQHLGEPSARWPGQGLFSSGTFGDRSDSWRTTRHKDA